MQKLSCCPEVNISQSFGSLKVNFGPLAKRKSFWLHIIIHLLLICEPKVTGNLEKIYWNLLQDEYVLFVFKDPEIVHMHIRSSHPQVSLTTVIAHTDLLKWDLVHLSHSFAFAAGLVSLFLKRRFKFHE